MIKQYFKYFILLGVMFLPSFCFAQVLSQAEAIEVEQIKQRESDIIYSEFKTIPVVDDKNPMNIIGSKEVVDYSYLGNEVDQNQTIFKEGEQYSNIKKIDATHFQIYSEPLYFKNDNGQVQEIINTQTDANVWLNTKLETTADKILSILHTPYAIADTIYSSAYDGSVARNVTNESWATIITSTGTANYPNGASGYSVYIVCGSTPGTTWNNVTRSMYAFDLSSIGSGYQVDSASFFLKGLGKTNDLDSTIAYNIYSLTPANPSALTNGDTLNCGTTAYSSNITNSAFNASGYNEWAFNTTGKSALSLTGINYFCLREAPHDVGASAPTCTGGGGSEAYIYTYFSEQTGTSDDPYLALTVSEISTTTPPVETNENAITCGTMNWNQKCTITGYEYASGTDKISTTTAVTTYNFLNLLFLVFEVVCVFLIIVGIVKFKRN